MYFMSNKTHAQILREWMDKISEAPLADFAAMGDFPMNPTRKRLSGKEVEDRVDRYSNQDKRLLQNKSRVKILQRSFSKCPFDIRIFIISSRYDAAKDSNSFANIEDANEYNAALEKWEHLMQNDDTPTMLRRILTPEEYSRIFDHRDGNITLVVNGTAETDFALTPWILAHKIAHGLCEDSDTQVEDGMGRLRENLLQQFSKVFTDYSGVPWDLVWNDKEAGYSDYYNPFVYLGTFKSARDKKVANTLEAIHEWFAQYIITGATKVNPLSSLHEFIADHGGEVTPEKEQKYANWHHKMETFMNDEFYKVLTRAASAIVFPY
jgi:hypothetical protein